MSFDFSNKVVLVTGASRGIGREIAQIFAENGATVLGTATSEGGAAKISEYLGDNGRGLVLNVTEKDSIAALFDVVKSDFGAIDILVNNAGITKDVPFKRMSFEQWNDVISTNLNSMFNVTQPLFQSMCEQGGGRIINISSINGLKGQFGQANYAAAKAGMIGFTKSLALESARYGVTVNAIAPGYIKTNNTQALQDDEMRNKAILERIPAGRWGNAEDIAGAAVFLASDAANYIHGSTLEVDGGWMGR